MTNLSYWPFESPPRANQIKALEWLEKQDARYLILESPVGSGKSNIGIAYQQFLTQQSLNDGSLYRDENLGASGKSYILTPQRILQAQYEESFKDIEKVNLASFY